MSQKLCTCGRPTMTHKDCCNKCWNSICADYEERLFNASQHSQYLQRIEAPVHDYSAAAAGRVPAARNGQGGA